jgi:hypothetical protein
MDPDPYRAPTFEVFLQNIEKSKCTTDRGTMMQSRKKKNVDGK